MSEPTHEIAWLSSPDGRLTVGYGPFTRSPTPPQTGVAFYRQDFSLGSNTPWHIPSRVEHISRAAPPPESDTGKIEWTPPDAVPFSHVFQEILSCIRQGEFEKTVPVVTEEGTCGNPPGTALRHAMWKMKAPLMSYGWDAGGTGFAGATPELLFSISGRRLNTMALAGTARSEDLDAFAVDEKEIREHEYVAQSLVAKLLDYGQLYRSPREILHLGSIVHFLTPIAVDLHEPPSPSSWIRRLHPTPALGPLPRTPSTMQKLLEWRDRLHCPQEFGAPFGVWESGEFRAIVAIRGVWWRGNSIRIPAGCGIIEASRLVNEWRELRLKRESVKAFLR